MSVALSIAGLTKTYGSGFQALKRVDLEIHKGELFALLGPNGAGKTTLISIVCGIVNASSGVVLVDGHDIHKDYRAARSKIGLVPQELSTDAFESVWDTVTFSRGLFGCAKNPRYIETLLRELSLWEKRSEKIMALSGGMKRRVLIAKALSHEPELLFLDEPTAGVDVNLRRDMWNLVRDLRKRGVTIVLTTHYIQEAEEMADRVGVINKGELILVEDKTTLMRKLGERSLTLRLQEQLKTLPAGLEDWKLSLSNDGRDLTYVFHSAAEHTGIAELLKRLSELGIGFSDLHSGESSLEEIFVRLVEQGDRAETAGSLNTRTPNKDARHNPAGGPG
ncbi:MAG: Daunorubicin/doxorubicin resistance ATP-binding protein DrrA [Pseudomonadota bacterium]|jgi:ABC-2 type transport system ATP-binding protein